MILTQQKNYKDYYALKKSLTSGFDKNTKFRLENINIFSLNKERLRLENKIKYLTKLIIST
jgi:ferredoxin-fold anticodon binding domain-containing protein